MKWRENVNEDAMNMVQDVERKMMKSQRRGNEKSEEKDGKKMGMNMGKT